MAASTPLTPPSSTPTSDRGLDVLTPNGNRMVVSNAAFAMTSSQNPVAVTGGVAVNGGISVNTGGVAIQGGAVISNTGALRRPDAGCAQHAAGLAARAAPGTAGSIARLLAQPSSTPQPMQSHAGCAAGAAAAVQVLTLATLLPSPTQVAPVSRSPTALRSRVPPSSTAP